MKVGIVGLGKLGMPVALGMNLKGHDVMGYGKQKMFTVFKYKSVFYKNVDLNPACCQKQTFSHREIGPNGEPSIEVSI